MGGGVAWVQREDLPFPCLVLRGTQSRPEKRAHLAHLAQLWLRMQHRRGVRGAIMADMDHTLIDGNERPHNGFQHMLHAYRELNLLFPVHIVTARPNTDFAKVHRMLQDLGFPLPVDRLHMMDPHDYFHGEGDVVEQFKHGAAVAIARQHGGLVARFGDRLWDLACPTTQRTVLRDVLDRDCLVFRDPDGRLGKATVSFKLPGT